MSYEVRKATEQELKEIAETLANDDKFEEILNKELKELLSKAYAKSFKIGLETKIDSIVEVINDYYLTVLENYISDSPNFVGNIYTITWGTPEQFTILMKPKNGDMELKNAKRKNIL